MFYPPKGAWTAFSSPEEKLETFKRWGVVSPAAGQAKPVVYAAAGVDRPMGCTVLGYREPFVAVVDVEGNLSCIHGNFLAETQPDIPAKMLGGLSVPQFLEDYVVMDLETTGLNPGADRIIEVSAIRFRYGQETGRFHQLVDPQRALPPEIVQLTGITQDMVNGKPKFPEIRQVLLDFLRESPLVGHNLVRFDAPFLAGQLEVDLLNPKVDTLPMARRVFPGLPSYRLQSLAKALQLGAGIAHRATADVETTHALLNACLAPGKYRRVLP